MGSPCSFSWHSAYVDKYGYLLVTFGNLNAVQISTIIFQFSALYHTEFDFLCLLIHLRPRKNAFKYHAFFIV